jgi:hypothetical protein
LKFEAFSAVVPNYTTYPRLLNLSRHAFTVGLMSELLSLDSRKLPFRVFGRERRTQEVPRMRQLREANLSVDQGVTMLAGITEKRYVDEEETQRLEIEEPEERFGIDEGREAMTAMTSRCQDHCLISRSRPHN